MGLFVMRRRLGEFGSFALLFMLGLRILMALGIMRLGRMRRKISAVVLWGVIIRWLVHSMSSWW
jgi:MFS superfamily sulfate permease-like transporter